MRLLMRFPLVLLSAVCTFVVDIGLLLLIGVLSMTSFVLDLNG